MILVLTVQTDKMDEKNMNEFCVNVEPTAEKGLKNLGKMLHDGYQLINARMFKKGSIASKYQFIYFNRNNLALKIELEGVAGSAIDIKQFKKNYKNYKSKKSRRRRTGKELQQMTWLKYAQIANEHGSQINTTGR